MEEPCAPQQSDESSESDFVDANEACANASPYSAEYVSDGYDSLTDDGDDSVAQYSAQLQLMKSSNPDAGEILVEWKDFETCTVADIERSRKQTLALCALYNTFKK